MRKLVVTGYVNNKATEGTRIEADWADLVTEFSAHEYRPTDPEIEKTKGIEKALNEAKNHKCFIPGVLEGERKKTNVKEMHLMVLDIDDASPEKMEALLGKLKKYTYAAYTTHKSGHPHVKGQMRLRFVLPTKAPYSADLHPEAWQRMQDFTGGLIDTATTDASRLHYLPSSWDARPIDDPESTRCVQVNEGEWIDPFELPLLNPTTRPAEASPDMELDYEVIELRNVLTTITNAKSENMTTKEAARKILRGASYAEPGERHHANLSVTMSIANRSKHVFSEAAMAQVFGPSLATMATEKESEETDIKAVMTAYDGGVAKVESERKKTTPEHRQKEMIPEGKEPYTMEQLEAIAKRHSMTITELRHLWVIQKGQSYFMLGEDGYEGPFTYHEARPKAVELLVRSPVQLFKPTKQNPDAKTTIVDMVEDYGRVAKDVIFDMMLKESKWDKGIFHYATTKPRILVPVFHADLAEWLKKAGGELHDKLLDWLACAPDLHRQICALYTAGPAGAGKTVLAQGVAAYWTNRGPCEFENVVKGFNEDLLKCPVVLADEELPVMRDLSSSAHIRKMIGTEIRSLTRKYQSNASIEGNLRVMLAANRDDLLAGRHVFSRDDQKAIAQRVLFIKFPQEAADIYNGMDPDRKLFWLKQGIAEHMLWLNVNRQVTRGSRFWVEGETTSMHLNLVASSDWNSLVLEVCARYLSEPGLFQGKEISKYWLVGGGKFYVNAQGIISTWKRVFPETKREPELRQVNSALRAISQEKRVQLQREKERFHFYEIDLEHLWSFVEQQGIGDIDAMKAKVNTPVAADKLQPKDSPGIEEKEALTSTKKG